MIRIIFRLSIVLMFLCSAVFHPQPTNAQIAPTNSATISGDVSDSAGNPVRNAKVLLRGPKATSTQTDAHGVFVFIGVPFGTYQVTVAAVGLGTVERDVSVEGDINVAIHYEPAAMNGLKVIANVSSSANASFNVTPASITQVNPIQNAFDGKTSWRTILEQIPGVAQAGLGNGAVITAGVPDGPLVPVQLSINGALPYETATLLDDMPLIAGSSLAGGATAGNGTNLSYYPLNAFTSADVVRGPGANAPSIVDSIGGSFVLHSPGIVYENHYEFSVSDDPYGGIVTNALAAMHWKKLSMVLSYGVNDSPGPLNRSTIGGSSPFSPATIDGKAFSAYSPPCSFPSCYFGYLLGNYSLSSFPFYGYETGVLACCVNQSTAWSQHNGSMALTYAVSPSLSMKVFYAGSTANSVEPPLYYTASFMPPSGYAGGIPGGQYFLPGLGTAPEDIQQTSSLLEEQIVAQIGRGTLHLAALQNRTFTGFVSNSPTSGTVQLYGGGLLCSNTSPGCSTGTYVQTPLNGGTYDVTYLFPLAESCPQSSDNRDLLLNYTTPVGENWHVGFSFVKSYYNSVIERFLDGGLTGSTPPAASETTNEFRIFFGGDPSAKTSVDLSTYFANADYHVQNPNDATGNTYTDERYSYAAPRLGFVWRPIAAVAVRASAGGGFAEAPLSDLVGSVGFTPNGPPFCSSTSCSVTLTNTNLQPEKSFAFDLGMDIKLHNTTTFSLDVYRSNLFGQIYNSTAVTGTYLGLPLYTTQYGNLGESRYEGVLLDLRHETQRGVYWALSGGLTRGYIVSLPAGFYDDPAAPCTNCQNLQIVKNINFNGQFDASVPYSQALATLGYRWSPEKYLDLVGTYYGNNNTYFRPAFVELDGNVGYPISKNAALLVTFRNITGIYDNGLAFWSPGIQSGAPTVSGAPYVLYGEPYGPRTVLLTMKMHF